MVGNLSIAPLRNGIREASPADGPAYRQILERSSSRDRYYRFLHYVNVVSEAELSGYLGGPDTLAYIAESEGEPVGVIHATVEGAEAELAIIVIPEARHHGVGHQLVDHLIAGLQARGVRDLIAYSLSENEPFAVLVSHCGMKRTETDLGVDRWHRDL